MEGLIPYVMHVLKKRREYAMYQRLSVSAEAASSQGTTRLPLMNKMGSFDYSSNAQTTTTSDAFQLYGADSMELRRRPQAAIPREQPS
ncbi:hypothetical protein ACLOJK_003568 [Asimina triloba]